MKKRLFVSFIVILLFTSCAPKQPEQDTEIIVSESITDLITPAKPECGPGDDGPRKNKIDSPVDAALPVTFSWEIECVPDEYYIEIFLNEDNPAPVHSSYFETDGNEYTVSMPLEPATSYQWTLNAFAANDENLQIKTSPISFFYTGPLCTAEALVPPSLVSPVDGSVDTGKGWGSLEEIHAVIKYPVGDCLPRFFNIDYSLNADFTGEDIFNLSGPGGNGKREGEWLYFEDDSTGTVDCNLYYWRARAETDSDHSDWSETFTFFLDVYGNCFHFPEFKGLMIANCRSDPWVGENYIGVIRENETAELLGLNEDASWGMFKLKNELECWVRMSLVETVPPDALFFPGFYPVLEHTEKPKDSPVPAEEPNPEPQQGCMAPDASGAMVCQIPCPDPKYAARTCP